MTTDPVRVPVTLITGFLGSGKTTLLNRLLRASEAAGTMVIVNEFGEIGLDHELIEHSSDSVVLLANGCLCCQTKGDLVETLRAVAVRAAAPARFGAIDRVAIETTGLADPTAVIQVLLSDRVVNTCFSLEGVVTTFDAVNGLETLARHREALLQVAVADRVIVTKTDLLDGVPIDGLVECLARINPHARLQTGMDGIGWEDVFCGAARNVINVMDKAAGGHAHSHRRIHTFSIVRDDPISCDALELIMKMLSDNLGSGLLRVKGILNIEGEPNRPAIFHAVQTVMHDLYWLEQWPSESRQTRMVFITEEDDQSVVQEIISLADRMASRRGKLLPTPVFGAAGRLN